MRCNKRFLLALLIAAASGCSGEADPPEEHERAAMRRVLENTEERRALIPEEGTFGRVLQDMDDNEEGER